MSKTDNEDNLKPLADEYGKLKAQLADLKRHMVDIKEIFEVAGVASLEGDVFRLVISHVDDSTGPDWKKIALRYKPSKRVIEAPANQKVTQQAHVRVNVYARTGEES